VLSDEQFELHLEAGRRVDRVREGAFRLIGERLNAGVTRCRYTTGSARNLPEAGLVTDSGPIVAVNGHAGNPHFEPKPETDTPIRTDDFVLIDMWAKLEPAGRHFLRHHVDRVLRHPRPRRRSVRTVRDGRDRAIELVRTAVAAGQQLRGFEVDDAARELIRQRGYGDFFVHRTGHSDWRGSSRNGREYGYFETLTNADSAGSLFR